MSIDSPTVHTFVDPDAVSSLNATSRGSVLLPGEEGYAEAISSWAVTLRHKPAVAVMAETASDVSAAVAFAADHGLPVAVQATGHGASMAYSDGVLINTSRMQGVTIDPERRSARVEAGARWSSVVPLAHAHGLAPLSGSSPTVGVVGYTLGGGHGWLTRKYGRAADRILSADVVTATGELVHASPESEPDLFWALRGGGGNFGVVTALEFGLVPVEQVFGGGVMYPLTEAKRVFAEFSRWSETVPDEITASISIMRFPPVPDLPPALRGAQVVVIHACAVGDLERGEALIAPMRSLGNPVMDTFGVLPYSEVASISNEPQEPMPAKGATMMVSSLDEATVDALMEIAGPGVETPLLLVNIRDLRTGGARTDGLHADPRARQDGLLVYALGVYFDDGMGAALDGALAGLRQALEPFSTGRAMMNFMGDGNHGGHQAAAAFPEAEFARLRELKRRYDPENRFRFNHNIEPAPAG